MNKNQLKEALVVIKLQIEHAKRIKEHLEAEMEECIEQINVLSNEMAKRNKGSESEEEYMTSIPTLNTNFNTFVKETQPDS
jgi:uncharacterized protein (UPF0305 family)